MRNKVIYFLSVILSIIYIYVGYNISTKNLKINDTGTTQEFIQAKVTKVIGEELVNVNEVEGNEHLEVSFEADILKGDQKDKKIVAKQSIVDMDVSSVKKIEAGEKILVINEGEPESGEVWTFVERLRSNYLIILGIVFGILLLIFGKAKGVNTILALLFTIGSIFLVYVPSILSGYNIYLSSIITCVYIIGSTLLIVYGANKKSLATCLGCFGGIIVSGILILLMSKVLTLSGIVNEESMYLLYLNTEHPIDLKAIVFGAVLVGAIGAIMDVAIDISSSLREISYKIEKPTISELFKSGITIGRDIMGTMTNTLILAYIGSSLSTVLLLTAYNNSMISLFNKEMIVVEILQALIGSIGLLFTIPLTSFICAILYAHKGTSKDIFEKIKGNNA